MRAIIFLGGLAMASSWFLTWVELPFAGPDLSPASELGDRWADLRNQGWQTLVFLAGFVLAGLAAVQVVFGRSPGGMAFLAGISPIVVGVEAALRVDDFRQEWGLPFTIDLADMEQMMSVADDFLRLGLWAYLGGALLLILAGLSTLAARR
ncbi:MAG: hypothetical protein AAF376_04230 [Pseudomonadota bacterium]